MINVSSKKFRFDINALRALAVTGVLFFHYKIKYFNGGFSGVDVFFVISGYLMSRIIISAINDDRFSFRDFYAKRLKRIVPALLFIIIIVTLAGFFIFFPGEYQQNEINAFVSNAFISNIYYWKNSNYFDPASETNIFLHTWSLSVEWQFYLLYPVLLLIFHRLFKIVKIRSIAFMILTVAIMVFSFYYTNKHQTTAFYLLPTRAWEMMIGGIAFLLEDKLINKSLRNILAISGYFLIILSFVFLKETMAWPGIFTLLPVTAAFLVIISNVNQFKILSDPIIQFTGRVSYSLYLWHWPIYVTARYLGWGQNTIPELLLLIMISVGFAYLSYRYIESINFKTIRILALMAILLMVTCGLAYVNCNRILFKPGALAIANYRKDHIKALDAQFSNGGCFISSKQTGVRDLDKKSCLTIEKGKKNFLLIGDSHAADLSISLKEVFENQNIHLMQATSSGCLPILRSNGEMRCREVMDYVYHNFIMMNAKQIDGVIISAKWTNAPEDEWPRLVNEIDSTVRYLNRYGLRTIIIGQSEVFTIPYTTIAARENEYNLQIVNNYIKSDAAGLNNLLCAKFPSSLYINIYNDKIPPLYSDHTPYMFDAEHFTAYGAAITVKKIFQNADFKRFVNGTTQ